MRGMSWIVAGDMLTSMGTPVSTEKRGAASVPSWATDSAMAVAVAVLLVSVVALSQVGTDLQPDLGAYLFVSAFGAVLLVRRRLPVLVLALSVLGTFAYYALEYPPIGVALPVAAALFSTAERGLLMWAVGGGAVVFVVSLAFRLRDDPQPVGYLLGTESVSTLALIAAAISLGHGLHAHRIAAAQREKIARLNKAVERDHLSRELHDSVGHGLSVISLHAGVARDAVGDANPDAARALDHVRNQATSTLTELRTMLRLLRSDNAPDSRGPLSLRDIESLCEEVRAVGIDVKADVEVNAEELSAAVDATAYRVVQEALTNVLRHARATSVQVSARVVGAELVVTVVDDGRGDKGGDGREGSGLGLAGMGERIGLLGGTLSVQPSGSAGFSLCATLPARLAS